MNPSPVDQVDEILSQRGDRQLAVFLDYDGTLTPIVGRPENAVLSHSMRRLLRCLAERAPTAILSGRDLADLRQRVDVERIIYAGSHGFDIAGPDGLRKQVATEFLTALNAAEKELREEVASIFGAFVERKRFSIAAHYRQIPDERVSEFDEAVNAVGAHHHELRKITGKKVYELQPDIDWDKGKALLWLLKIMGSKPAKIFPVYIGDDLTDEDAFRVVRQRGAGIIVSEQPRPSVARYLLKNPAEVELFLGHLAARLASLADS